MGNLHNPLGKGKHRGVVVGQRLAKGGLFASVLCSLIWVQNTRSS